MELIICISDFWRNKTYYRITPPKKYGSNVNVNRIFYNLEILHTINRQRGRNAILPVVNHVMKRCKCNIDGISFFYLNKELLKFYEYRRLLTDHLNSKGIAFLWLQIVQPEREIIDWKWNWMLSRILWEKIETEHLMSWLSTLGGAFSALGEQFPQCAKMAGKISQKQLMIGIKWGDPFIQSRCKLFYSMSLIQTGALRAAKYIIRQEYNFACRHVEVDRRLVKMCQGIWLKLQYEYSRRLQRSKTQSTIK